MKRVLCLAAALLLCLSACSAGEGARHAAGESPAGAAVSPSLPAPEAPGGESAPPEPSATPPETPAGSGEPSPSVEPSPSGEPSPSAKPSPSEEPSPSAEPSPGAPPSVEPSAAAPSPAQEAVRLSDVREAMLSAVAVEDPLRIETDSLYGLYGIEESWVAQSASFVTMSGVFPDEVILVQAVDESAAQQVAGRLQARLDEVLTQAETYDPESYAAAKRCGVAANGLFVCLILSPSQEALASIYGQYVK